MLVFGSEYLTIKTEQVAVEMAPNRALTAACRMTDQLRNKNVKGKLGVKDISTKINKNRSEIATAVVKKTEHRSCCVSTDQCL
jgi:hypothetical protein